MSKNFKEQLEEVEKKYSSLIEKTVEEKEKLEKEKMELMKNSEGSKKELVDLMKKMAKAEEEAEERHLILTNIIEIDIHSKISIKRPDIIETVKKQFIEKFETTKRLGWKVTKSWIIANLFVEGVENVELIEPREDVVVLGNECAVLGYIKLDRI